MNPLVFLALALVVSVVGTVALWVHNRRPDTPDVTIDEFRSKMRALADEDQGPAQHLGGRGRGDASQRGGDIRRQGG